MNTEQLEQRQSGAETETFVLAKTAEGFRVCSPLDPAKQYVVSGIPDQPHCTCSEFQKNEGNPQWVCRHIMAVLGQGAPVNVPTTHATTGQPSNGRISRERPKARENGGAGQMVLKRSVSPDGRIDSLSVEFTCPIGQGSAEAVKAHAEYTLSLQAEIVEGFLKRNAKPHHTETPQAGNGNGTAAPPQPDGAVTARMVKVAGMDTKWGRRLYIAVEVKDQTLKLFGTEKQLAEALTGAGFVKVPERIPEGMALNFPCRVITKPSNDGKYLNIDKVLPAVTGNGG